MGMKPREMIYGAFSSQLAGFHTITKVMLIKVCEELQYGVSVCRVAREADIEHH
jgi:hypothetical protein